MPHGNSTAGLSPDLGQGLGLRPQHYAHVLEHLPAVDWFEVISENFMGLTGETSQVGRAVALGGRPIENLEKIRASYPLACHGVSLSIGSVDPLDLDYLKHLKRLVDRFEPAIVSDHLCWTSVNGENLHDLLPLPYTLEAIGHVVSRIVQVQDYLQRPILIENVSSYLSFAQSEMAEWDFLNAICQRAGCGLLLDINNIYVSARNHGFDPLDFVNSITPSIVGQFHLAGHSDMGEFLVDTHDQPVPLGVWDLYRAALRRFGSVATMIERDDNIPPFEDLLAESRMAQNIEEQVLGKSRSTSKLASVRDHAPERRSGGSQLTPRPTSDGFV